MPNEAGPRAQVPAPRRHATAPYDPPPIEWCDEMDLPIRLQWSGHELHVRYLVHQNLIVDFAVGQVVRRSGTWHDVAKIRVEEGCIRRHQHFLAGVPTVVETLDQIPDEQAWRAVDEWYDKAVQLLEHTWEANLRRWRGV